MKLDEAMFPFYTHQPSEYRIAYNEFRTDINIIAGIDNLFLKYTPE